LRGTLTCQLGQCRAFAHRIDGPVFDLLGLRRVERGKLGISEGDPGELRGLQLVEK
jgi:hypothetical protein